MHSQQLSDFIGNCAYGLIKEFLGGKSDRALVIVGAANIDDALREMLVSFLAESPVEIDELLDGDSPLSTFSARTRLAYRLRLIDATLVRACNLIRKMRNAFAHEAEAPSLESGPQKQRVAELLRVLSGCKGVRESLSNLKQLDLVSGMHDGALTFTICAVTVASFIKTLSALAEPLPDNVKRLQRAQELIRSNEAQNGSQDEE